MLSLLVHVINYLLLEVLDFVPEYHQNLDSYYPTTYIMFKNTANMSFFRALKSSTLAQPNKKLIKYERNESENIPRKNQESLTTALRYSKIHRFFHPLTN